MKRIFLAMLAGMLAMWGAAALSAEPSLTLAQARAAALARSSTLRKANLAVDAAVLTEKTQGYDFLPSITATVGAGTGWPSASFVDSLQGTAGLTVNQAVYDGGKSALLTAIDSLDTNIARQEARAEYFGTLQAVDTAYHGVLRAHASVDAARADLDAARTRLSLAQAKSAANMITKIDLQDAEAAVAARDTALIQAQGSHAVAEATLASLTGLPAPFSLQGIDFAGQEDALSRCAALSGEGISGFAAGVQKAANANNPTLSQAALASQRAKKSIDLATAGYLPSVNASFSHGVTVGTAQPLGPGSGSVSVTATIPLDLWTTKAGIDAKTIAAKQAGLDEEESRRTFALQVQSGVYSCVAAARSVVSSTRAIEYSEATYQGVLERYKLSAASPTEVSDAEALVSSSGTALIAARYSFLDSFSGLRTLAGLETGELLAALLP
jgi:outer membrane protein